MPRITRILKLCVAAVITVSIAIFVGPGGAVFFVAGGSGYAWWRGRRAERQTEPRSSWLKTLWEIGMSDYLKVFRAPLWLWIFAITTIGEVVLVAILGGNYSYYAPSLLIAMLISLLLLRGIPEAWCIAVVIGVYAIVASMVTYGPRWPEACYLLQMGLLFAPASRRYVWQGEGFLSWLRSQSIGRRTVGQLAAFIFVTFILAAIMRNVRSHHPNLVIDALWAVAFGSLTLAIIALPCLLALNGAGWIARRIQPEVPN